MVSSADFGRAYLSDGWATRFIQSLLSRYQIVFIGYTAEDPPVQYLLEALNLQPGTRNRLYAFQDGESEAAKALWTHKGVEPITFDSANGFGPLWDTLDAWAARTGQQLFYFSPRLLGGALLFSVLLGAACAVYATARIVRLSPAEAIRRGA